MRCAVASLVAALALCGCAGGPGAGSAGGDREDLGYYWQAAAGHLQMLHAARPVADWLEDPATPERLRARLQLAQRIRAFASRELALPDNASYRRYADLQRPAALWNVVAAPALSLTLRTWCFPVAGCVGYRGWFDEAGARAEAQRLREAGWDATVYPVPAYSTLGWLNWAGGDPLLNTFIGYGEGELARLIFHELAHQVLYVKDDTAFNESFATAVERLGVQAWLAREAGEGARAEYAAASQRRDAFRALVRATRQRLQAIYEAPVTGAGGGGATEAGAARAGDSQDRLARKAQVLADFRAQYAGLRAAWGGDPARLRPTDRWVEEANNASFGAQAAYDDLVPAFEALFEREGRDWRRFFAAVKELARLAQPERQRALQALAGG
ncbi:aminopeptidase [Ramlibacter sp. MAHUQ-53]|uniref:aminopeptidase n=1 Tax=unclassified Ramlibacter TaxID=2617605 RepID=UPI00363A773B